ncbi:hypothetical protein NLG97_g1485 [Lecanicillium saksenae]|uniref:Uncharacterized protein n=1 Tax=Lecanicillium saksenae TaxID=468837 RepID=A0ACC1R724_9HYPO|nr:hypothetical protein NLG97_g1485 [Lecanicillium saksenae]
MKFAIVALAAAIVQASPVPEERKDGLPIPVHPADLPIPDGLLPMSESDEKKDVKKDDKKDDKTKVKKPEETIHACAMPCVEAYVQKHTKCALDDYKCICRHKEVKDKDAVICVINACGFSRAKNIVYPAMIKFCKPYSTKD